MSNFSQQTSAPTACASPVDEVRPRVFSEQILQGARTAEIVHAGQLYLLRVTRENKLILTK